MMQYKFHPDALMEYREAALWYSNRERTLALRFTKSIEETIRRIVEAPERWRVIDEDVRRCLAPTFPFAILYTIEKDSYLSWQLCTGAANQVIGASVSLNRNHLPVD